MMKRFGPPWPSNFCDDPEIKVITTPVGTPCSHCDEPIAEGDNGVVYSNGPVAHRNCYLRGIIGSVAHIQRRCSCYVPGAIEGDDPSLTRREAADAAVRLWETGKL